VVIGGRVFAASVDSQSIPAARHDVRAAGHQAGYVPYDLPEDVRRALLEMVRGLGLRFCSADLVLTPDGRHVFLDLNPNGQWLWLELEAGLLLTHWACISADIRQINARDSAARADNQLEATRGERSSR
jgi:hypothetical protein